MYVSTFLQRKKCDELHFFEHIVLIKLGDPIHSSLNLPMLLLRLGTLSLHIRKLSLQMTPRNL